GSGIGTYDIYVSDDGGPFTHWLTATTLTSATYDGLNGHTYAFYSEATDNVGNVEAVHTKADTQTTVELATPANVTNVSVEWGTQSMAVQTTADGLRLLPTGRNTDMPWTNINAISITLSQPETLSPGDVTATGITVANYGPVTISGSGTSYTITLAQAITKADRVTISIGNAGITNFTRRLDVLPGDMSDDGVVTLADGVSIIQNYSPPKVYSAFRDLNGDGLVNVNDFTAFRPYLNTTMPNVPIVLAQLAAGGAGPGGFTQLTNAELEPVLADAIARWTSVGIPAQDVALLHRVTAQIAPLPDGYLGGAAPGGLTIYLSPDAAGYGWNTSTGNFGGEDLETVVVHELAHSLGLYDLNPKQVANDLMTETLAAGVSRLPSALDVAAVNALYAAASNASQATPNSAALPADPGFLAAVVFATQPSLAMDWNLPAPLYDAPASDPEMPAPGAAVILADQTKPSASVDLPRVGAGDESGTNHDVWPDIFGEGKA
ncbi:MAG TPA: hypothetical protein VNX28_13900, partial [Gemmataceae bacterium]|nr:hypothetical protein [Gemmataceae bacterium]